MKAPKVEDAWKRLAIGQLMHGLAVGSNASVVALDKLYELKFSVDEKTQFFANPADDKDVTIVGLRLDITRRAE